VESLKEIPSLEPFEDDEGGDEEEDEDMDDATSEATTPKEDKRGRIRRLFDNLYLILYHRLRFFLIRAYKRYFVVPPEVGDMYHYAQCNWCKRYLTYQGWEVEFKVNEEDKINQITFRHKDGKRDKRRLSFYV